MCSSSATFLSCDCHTSDSNWQKRRRDYSLIVPMANITLDTFPPDYSLLLITQHTKVSVLVIYYQCYAFVAGQ